MRDEIKSIQGVPAPNPTPRGIGGSEATGWVVYTREKGFVVVNEDNKLKELEK